MRKRIISISGSVIFIIMIGITGCNAAKATSNPTPEQVYSDDNNVDMFVYEDIVYINAAGCRLGKKMRLLIKAIG